MSMPILDVCWNDDSSKVFVASCNKQVKCWDLESNQMMQVANHSAPIKTCHWIKTPIYSCLMTGSWDKTLKVYLIFNFSIYKHFSMFLFALTH